MKQSNDKEPVAKAATHTPAADASSISHAARVLATLKPGLHADTALRNYFAYWHRIGPREKRAISYATFVYFRWLEWLDHKSSSQKQIAEAIELQKRFDANPASVKTEALAARAIPEWARNEVDYPPETLRLIQKDPTLWIRTPKSAAASVFKALAGCEPATEVTFEKSGVTFALPKPVTAFHYTGKQDLFLTPQFHEGQIEIQDIASQLVSYACAPIPGQTWWDTCAGEGGKTMHLADLMQNKGMLWASDRSFRRLQALKRRAARGKVFNYRAAPWEGDAKLPTKTKFDGILIDAPCSGLGTWQRNPQARWTTTMTDVQELAAVQTHLLNHVANSLKPGGRLVYAVCTLTRSETTAVADAFTATHADLEPVSVFPGSNAPAQLTIWPHEVNGNGMFIAAWRRKMPQ